MAVSATFKADFREFQRGVEDAQVKLRSFQDGIGRIDKDLAKFGNQFSGTKVIQEGLLIEKAIRDIGGTSKLTSGELERAGAAAKAAVEKMRALGVDVPDNLQNIAKHAKTSSTELTAMGTAVSKIGPMLAGAFSVGALTSFAKEIGEFSGKMVDLSAETGIGIGRLQELDYVAAGAGLTIEDITLGVSQLSKRLAGGDDSAVGAMDRLGLSVYQLQAQGPDEAFLSISRAIATIEDPMVRTQTAMELFGRSGAKMLRLMTDDVDGLIAGAKSAGAVIDEELIRKADEFDDAWSQGWKLFKAHAVGAIGSVARGLSALQEIRLPGASGGAGGTDTTGLALGVGRFMASPLSAVGSVASFGYDLWRGARADADLDWFVQRAGRSRGSDGLAFGDNRSDARPFQEVVTGSMLQPLALPNDLKAIEKGLDASTKAAEGLNKELERTRQRLREAEQEAQESAILAGRIQIGGQYFRDQEEAINSAIAAGLMQPLPYTNRADRLPGQVITGVPWTPTQNRPSEERNSRFADFGASFGPTVIGALMGGGDVKRSVAAGLGQSFTQSLFGKDSTSKFGGAVAGLVGKLPGALGDIAGSFLPGIGALAGPALSLISSGIGKLFGAESKRTNRTRDQVLGEQFGTQDEFRRLAVEAGVADAELRKVFDAKKVKDFEAAFAGVSEQIQKQQQILEKYNITWADLSGPGKQKGLADEVTKLTDDMKALERAGVSHEMALERVGAAYVDLAIKAVEAGEEIPAALAPTIRDLALMGKLTEEQAARMLGLANASSVDFERMEQIATKYGIALEALGPKFQQAKIGATAKSIIDDFQFLIDAGADVGGVINGMSDEIQQVVMQALQFGLKLPETMRPVLEQMLRQGLLTDENGEKLKDLAGIQFAAPIEESVQKLIDKMTELIDRIGGVGDALAGLPSVDLNTGGQPDPGYDPNGLPGYATGTGGRYLNFGSGTTVRLHGDERVMTAAEGRAEATGWRGMLQELRAIRADMARRTRLDSILSRDRAMILRGQTV